MITLPKLAVTSDVDTSQSTGLVKGKGLSADFLSLLGQTLNGQLTLADGKTVSLAQLNQDLQQAGGSDSSSQGGFPYAAFAHQHNQAMFTGCNVIH